MASRVHHARQARASGQSHLGESDDERVGKHGEDDDDERAFNGHSPNTLLARRSVSRAAAFLVISMCTWSRCGTPL